jgi:hypothetical protein
MQLLYFIMVKTTDLSNQLRFRAEVIQCQYAILIQNPQWTPLVIGYNANNAKDGTYGTHNLTNPPTSWRQVTQLPKLFIARLTLHSSHTQRHRQGHVMIERGLVWQMTHGGPSGPRPEAPDSHVCASGPARLTSDRRARMKFSSISDSSSGVGFRFSLPVCWPESRENREDRRTCALSRSIFCWN